MLRSSGQGQGHKNRTTCMCDLLRLNFSYVFI